jgi:GNAT superfamily N-acetyltransferase
MALSIDFQPGRVDREPGAGLLRAMRDEMAEVYCGLDLNAANMPRVAPDDMAPPNGAFLVGWHNGTPVCCGGLKRLPDGAVEIKRMFVVPSARSQGVARLLLTTLETTASDLGYEVVRLDTGPRQPHARALYESLGYQPIHNFNGNPVASFWGEKRLPRTPCGPGSPPASPS